MPGPLVARWLSWSLDEPRAGALGRVRVEVENAGSATWRDALAAPAEAPAVVAPSIEAPRRLRRALAPWGDGAGRNPGFAHPLLCPSVLHGIEIEQLPDVEGLPAFAAPPTEPWIYDGRVVVRPG